MVVAIHTNPIVHVSNVVIKNFYEAIVRMAVPFFFICSGFLLEYKIKRSGAEKELFIIKKFVAKNLKMYIKWSIIYIPLAIYDYYTTDMNPLKAGLSYILKFIFMGEHYNSWPLWYLLSTIYAGIMIYILRKIDFSINKICVIGAFVQIPAILITVFTLYSGELGDIPNLLRKVIGITIGNGRIFQGMIYVPVGMYLYHEKFSIKSGVIILITSIIINLIRMSADISLLFSQSLNIIIYLLEGATLFIIALNLSITDSKNISFIKMRKYSTYIYLIHMYVWSIYCLIRYRAMNYGFLEFITTLIISLMIAVIFEYIKKINLGESK